MRVRTIIISALVILGLGGVIASARAEETKIRVGAIDAVLTTPPDVEEVVGEVLKAGKGGIAHIFYYPGINMMSILPG